MIVEILRGVALLIVFGLAGGIVAIGIIKVIEAYERWKDRP